MPSPGNSAMRWPVGGVLWVMNCPPFRRAGPSGAAWRLVLVSLVRVPPTRRQRGHERAHKTDRGLTLGGWLAAGDMDQGAYRRPRGHRLPTVGRGPKSGWLLS